MFFSFYRFIVSIGVFLFWTHFALGVETFMSPAYLFIEDQYCLINLDGNFECDEQLVLEVYRDMVTKYFLDSIYENTFCRCGDNNGCTRGCRLPGRLEEKHYPPVRRCVGRKSNTKPSTNCAMHVNGAIMTVIHDFLYFHCRFATGGRLESRAEYDQCDAHFTKNESSGNVNICWNGFKFESALCMLNLDGQGADVYNVISNRRVRRNCKNWDRYNQFLLAVNASSYYGYVSIIPIFKRLPAERNKEFRRDPRQIPEGAIVVTRSHNKHGHVEVKTNRQECGKDKNLTCFCSDFCRERIQYDYSVLAVFEWNPEFIKYVSSMDLWSNF